jgi:hypothetical protein
MFEANQSDRIAQLPFDGTASLAQAWPVNRLGPAGIRVVISDYLFPAEPAALVQRAVSGAARLCFVQLLDPWEAEPAAEGPVTLTDAETAESVELSLDSALVASYRERLAALQQEYAQSCAACNATWVAASTAAELEQLCREQMVTAGLLWRAPEA